MCIRTRRPISPPPSRRGARPPVGALSGRNADGPSAFVLRASSVAPRTRNQEPRTPLIAHLRGKISEKHPNRIVVDVNGVGYDVFVPLSTFYGLGEPGADVGLRIHTHVREDALNLYGFATLIEQELFERLISVSGIGPKVALAVLSGIEPQELVRAT